MAQERFGIRMSVLGKTRSGKSTALYRLLAELVPLRWSKIIVLDGKRDVLRFTAADSRVTYFNNTKIEKWCEVITAVAEGMDGRYEAMEQGQPVDPVLLVIDEVQAGTRDKMHRRDIRWALMEISEKSGALGDCLILTTQRPANAIPPAVTHNCNAFLTMLGYGYFHFRADDMATEIGRSTFITPAEAGEKLQVASGRWHEPAALASADLLEMLQPQIAQPKDGRLTVFTGEAGGGLTHRLMSYASHGATNKKERIVSVNMGASTHKQMLVDILTQCDAATPPKAKISDLAAMAGLAVASLDTLLLLDNLHMASAKTHISIQQIIPFAAETAVSFATPVTSLAKIQAFEWCLARGRRVEVSLLEKPAAQKLALAHLDPALDDKEKQAATRRIIQISHGHAKTIVAAAKSVETGKADELRQMEGRKVTEWSLLWLAIAFIIVIVVLNTERMNSYTATAVVLVVMLILRRLLSRSLRTVIPRR